MRKDFHHYTFHTEVVAKYYDLRGVMANLYNTAFIKLVTYKHKPLVNVEKYRNIRDENKVDEIYAALNKSKAPLKQGNIETISQEVKNSKQIMERPKEVPLKMRKSPPKNSVPPSLVERSPLPSFRKRQGTIGQHATMGSSKRKVEANAIKISQEVVDLKVVGYDSMIVPLYACYNKLLCIPREVVLMTPM